MIDENHLLIPASSGWRFLKIDYKSWKVKVLPRTDIKFDDIVIDQFNKNNFLMYNRDKFVMGNLDNDQIVLTPRRPFNFKRFDFRKLAGNQLIGLHISERQNNDGFELLECSKIDLITLREETFDVPFVLTDNYSTLSLRNVSV